MATSHMSQALINAKFADARARSDMLRDAWLTEAAVRQAEIAELQFQISSLQREMDSLAQQMAGRYSTFHGYFDHCVSVFDREGLYTVSDRILSEALLALGTMGAGTWASGTRAVALTPGHGA